MRVSLPVSGLDTSTPDQTVADGKCEELHNLRWESGSWHNIDPLKIKSRLSPTAGQEALFEKLTIIYHHPAAGDDAYIASIPNADGTINLFLATVVDGVLNIDTNNICPIYINNYLGGSVETISMRIALVSLKPVASDVSVEVNYKSTLPGQESRTIRFTIPQGFSQSNNYVNYAVSENNENAYPVPSRDDTYRYMVFTSEEAARNYNGSFASGLPADIRITHFGNVLITNSSTSKEIRYFRLVDDSYKEFEVPAPPILQQSVKRINMDCNQSYTMAADGSKEYFYRMPLYNTVSGTYYPSLPINDAGYWHGEICCFAAFEMMDGTIVSPSGMLLFASELDGCSEEDRSYSAYGGIGVGDVTLYRDRCSIEYRDGFGSRFDHEVYLIVGATYTQQSSYETSSPYGTLNIAILPTIQICLPECIDVNMIPRIVIYSTRRNPIYDTEKFQLKAKLARHIEARGYIEEGYFSYIDQKSAFADNRLPEQPFYKLKTIELSDFKDNKYSLDLTYDLLKDVEHNMEYEAGNSLHDIYFNGIKEYNNRVNIYDISTRLHPGHTSEMIQTASSELAESAFVTTLESGGSKYMTEAKQSRSILKFGKIMMYPDWRATQMQVFEGSERILTTDLVSASAMNIAYKCRFTEESETVQNENAGPRDPKEYADCYVKYPCFKINRISATKPIYPSVIIEPNRLQVSAPNNPFSFPLANSYAIGTENNRILAVNSAAIEMSDAKFGEFPLYVFTDEGIFTLQSGSGEVLYSATIPLNYDRIVNPATLAVNHNVLYVTARGIMAMFSNESRLISEPINNLHNTPPLDYLRTAKMCYQPAHNEVIVWNPAHAIGRAVAGTRAYVFSLDGGYWSTRDLEGVKLNTDELVVHTSNQFLVLDLSEEEARSGQPVRIRLVTRPLKFGSTEFKRLETFVARLHTQSPQSLRLLFEGSTDLKAWTVLRDTGFFRTDRDTLLRRFPGSIRFLRVTLEADLDAGFELAQFDAEYYTRFLHRLR